MTEPSAASRSSHLCNMSSLNQRLRFVDIEIVRLVALLSSDDQDVTESLRGNQSGRGAFTLENSVGCNGRRMQHGGYIMSVAARFTQDCGQPFKNRDAWILRRRRHLA